MISLKTFLNNITGASDASLHNIQVLMEVNSMAKALRIESTMFYLPAMRALKNSNLTDGQLTAQGVSEVELQTKLLKETQYQDVMRQKLAHMILLNDYLIQEMKQKLNGATDAHFEFLPLLPMIVKLHVAQVNLICREFTESKDKVQKGLAILFGESAMFGKNGLKILALAKEMNVLLNKIEFAFFDHHVRYQRKDLRPIEILYTMNSERILLYKIFLNIGEDSEFDNQEDLTGDLS